MKTSYECLWQWVRKAVCCGIDRGGRADAHLSAVPESAEPGRVPGELRRMYLRLASATLQRLTMGNTHGASDGLPQEPKMATLAVPTEGSSAVSTRPWLSLGLRQTSQEPPEYIVKLTKVRKRIFFFISVK